jgi:hypothetical protein
VRPKIPFGSRTLDEIGTQSVQLSARNNISAKFPPEEWEDAEEQRNDYQKIIKFRYGNASPLPECMLAGLMRRESHRQPPLKRSDHAEHIHRNDCLPTSR